MHYAGLFLVMLALWGCSAEPWPIGAVSLHLTWEAPTTDEMGEPTTVVAYDVVVYCGTRVCGSATTVDCAAQFIVPPYAVYLAGVRAVNASGVPSKWTWSETRLRTTM